jgi:hypothetical protein
VIHYHGTPLTPRAKLMTMAGEHFCVSYWTPTDIDVCMTIGQSVMLDNGAFSAFTNGATFDPVGFAAWAEKYLGHPHWAVIPDLIDGSVEQQRSMRKAWPHPKELSAPVWHLGLPIDYLRELADEYPKICFGSTAQFWQIGSPAWCARMDEAFNALAKRRFLPWIHGLRMLDLGGSEYPLASADSVNVARNFKCQGLEPKFMAKRIDARNTPIVWENRSVQMEFAA